jgi:hypothetical protein
MADSPRVARLKSGDMSFGHQGTHMGVGTEDCPHDRHHHHDEVCRMPTKLELQEAEIDPNEFKARTRRF